MHAPDAKASNADSSATPWPNPMHGWTVVVLLALSSIASQFDRTVVNLAVEPLKRTFSLNDTQFGMLQGVAFGIFYVLACIPIGRLADRYQRRLIIAVGLLLFSPFAMASGLARTYWQLFLSRVGVGVGEASITPAGLSMLSDLFPPERLARPVGSFLMSSPVGQGLAFMIGGSLLQWLGKSPLLAAGPLAGFAPWQVAFMVIGFPGLLLAPLFLLLREPKRRGPGGEAPLTMREVAAVVAARRHALIRMFIGFAMVSLVNYVFFIWTPALFQRTYGWTPAQVGLGFGSIIMVCGASGVYFGGWMSDRLAARGQSDAPLTVAAFCFIGCGLFGVLAPLMPSAPLALALLVPAIFLVNTPYACAGAAIQVIVPNRARAQVAAMYVTMTNLIGLTIGPIIVGLMTDFVFKDPHDIRYSMAIVVAAAAPTMVVLLMLARGPFRALRAA